MKNYSLSLKVLKFMLGFSWWGTLIVVPLAMILVISFMFLASEKTSCLLQGYASNVDVSMLAAHTRDGGVECEVQLENPVRCNISVPVVGEGVPVIMLFVVLSTGLVCLGIFLFFIKQLRDIVRTVEQGDPFVAENAKRVRWIGLMVLFGGIASSLNKSITAAAADIIFVPTGFSLNGHFDFDFFALGAGLSILVLSEVFRHGTEMRDEQALTV